MKISFDFDDTLDRPSVQSFARWCIDQGHEVWVVTSRYPDSHWTDLQSVVSPSSWIPNEDLWNVTAELNIPSERVVFTRHSWKTSFFNKNVDFAWHLDDDLEEIANAHTVECPVRFVDSNASFWMRKCKEIMSDRG